MNDKIFHTYYKNPLINTDFPDPSVLYVEGDGYYAYGTHDSFSPTVNSIQVSYSKDLLNWTEPTKALVEQPEWAKECQMFWAPHVVKVGNEYRMYYSADPDTHDGMCLALAISSGPIDFKDIGGPLMKIPGSTYAMIDPCFFIDPKSGKHLFYYGSAEEPIRVVELDENGKLFISAPKEVLYPNPLNKFERLREGAFVTYNEKCDRYFLYVSGSNTWETDGYAISVYYSHDPESEFKKIPTEHSILKSNKYWDAPGQNCIITDAAGDEWLIYHAVDHNDRFIENTDKFKRKMCMDKIQYTKDGWPFIENASPSFENQVAPLITPPSQVSQYHQDQT